MRGWLVGVAIVGLGVATLGVVGFGWGVRAQAAREAARRGLDVEIGRVRPGLLAVQLKDVHVRAPAVPGVDVHLESVRVQLSAGLSVSEVVAHGGRVLLEGEPEELIDRVRSMQAAAPPKTAGRGERHRPMSVEALSLEWHLPSGGTVTGSGLKLARDANGTRLGAGRLTASYRRAALEVENADIELGPDGSLRHASASSAVVAQELARGLGQPTSASAVPAEPTPPPLPAAPDGRGRADGKHGKTAGALAERSVAAPPTPNVAASGPALPMPDVRAARARLAALTATLASRVPDGSTIDVAALSARLDVGGEPVSFGPGTLAMNRRGELLHVSFASDGAKDAPAGSPSDAHQTPLSIDADLPLGRGELTARFAGGPVSLALLGVKDGTKGLFDTARATLMGRGQIALDADGNAMTFDGQVSVRSLSIEERHLGSQPIRGLDFAVGGRGLLEHAGRLRLDDAQLDVGALHVRGHGTVEDTREHFAVSLGLEVAPAACQALVESVPQGLLPTVRAGGMLGTFAATARVAYDTAAVDDFLLDYHVDDRCRLTEVPRELSTERFAGAFTYRTYHPDGTPSETTTGPGTSSWTNLDDISPFMVAALLTTEDGAFYQHHGFNHAAIRSSVLANLKARRFVRGASTITMQLAKNLFLSREKTLSRKLEELVLTDYLEQVFRKDDMMELYLNVVEFGPDVYGITQAADYYFGRKPEELDLAECFFLASLLPSPVRYGKLREKGEVPEPWMKHLKALMTISAKYNKISRAELAEGLTQTLTFVRPGDPRPEPRKAVGPTRREPFEDAWQPLD